MSSLYRISSIDALCQDLLHLANRFQRRRFVYNSTNQKQELSVVATFPNGIGRN
jgi:hypothetical protein